MTLGRKDPQACNSSEFMATQWLLDSIISNGFFSTQTDVWTLISCSLAYYKFPLQPIIKAEKVKTPNLYIKIEKKKRVR